ncbi:MAG: tyrosine--tRNA ligase [Candidatus Brocadiae bacterium]|nr:tyrosine--tRNA ligase [Candidatus Brocadiia bacterium]
MSAGQGQLEAVARGAAEIVSREELAQRLALGRPLRIKLGVDPTSPDIHLGHTVVLQKLRQFQETGHQAVLIIGDFTALIGDPSGRNATRPPVSEEDVDRNAKTYLEQIGKVVDVGRLEIRRNSEWLAPLGMKRVLELAGKVTVARILERDDFQKRLKANQPISFHELLYPIMQGYDSVVVKADVELGGIDQTFNLMMGRNLQREYGQPPQVCLMTPILTGLDGVNKMSKSLGNHIGVHDQPDTMFGRAMSIQDAMMADWFTLLTSVPLAESAALVTSSPRDAKLRLAETLTARFHGAEAARAARERWDRVVVNRETPADVREFAVPASEIQDGKIGLARLLVLVGFATSNSDGRRLIEQGGLTVDGEKVTEAGPFAVTSGQVLRAGKKNRFVRLRV